MQVRKFEARTIKEALELVKNNLGPDAIILAVRDNAKKYGLVGQGSVEITAAVAEHTLRKKHFVESKISEQVKATLDRSSASQQKIFIDKMVKNHTTQAAPKPRVTERPYIEIDDHAADYGQDRMHAVGARKVTDLLSEVADHPSPNPKLALQRIRSAAREAWSAVQTTVETPTQAQPVTQSQAEVVALRAQINDLKKVIAEFKTVPQKFISAHPGAEFGLPFEMSFMFEKLQSAGVAPENIHAILTQAQSELPLLQMKKKSIVEAWVANFLLAQVKVNSEVKSRLQIFIGGSGQGKTATLVKFASRLVIENKKSVAIVTTDCLKIGAAEQLRIYAQILNVPFVIIRDGTNWGPVLQQLAAVDHILIDFPGLQLKDKAEEKWLERFLPNETSQQVHLVLSTNMKDKDAFEIAKRYQTARFDDVIFTCIDESLTHGLIYNFQKQFSTPLFAFGTGAQVPEDFEEASTERVLDLIFKLSKNQELFS